MLSTTSCSTQSSNITNNDENQITGLMDTEEKESAPVMNKKAVETAFGIMMDNSAKVFKSSKNPQSKRKAFGDIMNCQGFGSRVQKRNVVKTVTKKEDKHSPRQSTIAEFAVVKRKRLLIVENLIDKSGSDVPESSKATKWTTENYAPWNSSLRPDSGEDPESLSLKIEKKQDAKDSIRRAQIDRDSPISEDVEMSDEVVTKSWSQILGKRFNAIRLDDDNNLQQPLIKKQKNEKQSGDEESEIDGMENKANQNLSTDDKNSFDTNPQDERSSPDVEAFLAFANNIGQKYSLIIISKPSILTAGFACIEKDILKGLLKTMKPTEFIEKFALVDCRYPYEFDGGHIKGAVNIYDPVILEETFFPGCADTFQVMKGKIPIFYCEYSSARGPMFASHLRKSDRVRNFCRYPFVQYKEIYVLDGGYNSFYNAEDQSFKDLCEPVGYVSMTAREHSDALKIFRTHSLRAGIGFQSGMFETAVIRKNAKFRRTHSVPAILNSPTAEAFARLQPSPIKKHSPESVAVPMLVNPRTPTGRKQSR